MPDLAGLKGFDLAAADLTVWVFKRSTRDGVPVFNGKWVEITPELKTALCDSVTGALAAITETIDYDILAQNNESSALTLGADETHIAMVDAQALNPTPGRKIHQLRQIANAAFYMLRFATNDGVLLAVRKTNPTWSTRRSSNIIRVVFDDDQLDIDERPSFSLEPFFDFFVFNGEIYVSNKGRFESVLAYRAGHMEAFQELTVEADFSAIFSDVGPITEFVGENKIQLRRAIAIREKAHYKDAGFMQNLRNQCAAMNLQIAFDGNGRIVPTPETCRDIFQALLDHRLDSRLSNQLYDVQSTEPVA